MVRQVTRRCPAVQLPRDAPDRQCDSALHRVLTDGRSTILDFGTAQRTITAALWMALVLRDRHCRHPGCRRAPKYCEAHHVIPFPNGPTCLANLVLKCSRHHHIGHRPKWKERLDPDGTLTITSPDGRTWVTHPPGVTQPPLAA